MKVEQRQWTRSKLWHPDRSTLSATADLVLVFAETGLLKEGRLLREIKIQYPNAHLFGCSTSGEILDTHIHDESVSLTAIEFAKTKVTSEFILMSSINESRESGRELAKRFDTAGLNHVMVLSVGLNVNGSDLVNGMSEVLPSGVTISGGLAGDQDRFRETLVIAGGEPLNNAVAAVGFYGNHIKISSASMGGWDPFGPERLVTKAVGNVLYELDGQSALGLYKKYLGEHVNALPGSALLFPLCLRGKGVEEGVVRTILGISEADQSMTFAGEIPQGCLGRFMKSNTERLIDGAIGAAERSRAPSAGTPPDLAILISCVGRKLVLKQRVEEEIEGVRDVFGANTALTGFYSYGEISSFTPNAKCELHNQTMTITILSETNEEAA